MLGLVLNIGRAAHLKLMRTTRDMNEHGAEVLQQRIYTEKQIMLANPVDVITNIVFGIASDLVQLLDSVRSVFVSLWSPRSLLSCRSNVLNTTDT